MYASLLNFSLSFLEPYSLFPLSLLDVISPSRLHAFSLLAFYFALFSCLSLFFSFHFAGFSFSSYLIYILFSILNDFSSLNFFSLNSQFIRPPTQTKSNTSLKKKTNKKNSEHTFELDEKIDTVTLVYFPLVYCLLTLPVSLMGSCYLGDGSTGTKYYIKFFLFPIRSSFFQDLISIFTLFVSFHLYFFRRIVISVPNFVSYLLFLLFFYTFWRALQLKFLAYFSTTKCLILV